MVSAQKLLSFLMLFVFMSSLYSMDDVKVFPTCSVHSFAMQQNNAEICFEPVELSVDQFKQFCTLKLQLESLFQKTQELHKFYKICNKRNHSEIIRLESEILGFYSISCDPTIRFIDVILNKGAHKHQKLAAIIVQIDLLLSVLKLSIKSDILQNPLSTSVLLPTESNVQNQSLLLCSHKKLDLCQLDAQLNSIIQAMNLFVSNLVRQSLTLQFPLNGNTTYQTLTTQSSTTLSQTQHVKTNSASTNKIASAPSTSTTSQGLPMSPQTLHEAAQKNDCQRIGILVRQGCNINELRYGWSPLHVAIINQNYEATAALLSYKETNPDVYAKNGKTPLHCAVSTKFKNLNDQKKIVSELLARKVNVNAQICGNYWFKNWRNLTDLSGATALHLAARCGNFEIAKLLIENNASINQTNGNYLPGSSLCTPLYYAAISGHANIVQFLLEHGAKVLQVEEPLRDAVTQGHVEVVETFLAHNYRESGQLLYFYDPFFLSYRQVAFKEAVLCYDANSPKQASKYLKLAKLFLDNGAICTDQELSKAFGSDRNYEMAKLFAQYPFDANRVLRLVIAETGNDRCIRLLMAKGADVQRLPKDINNRYCLQYPLHEAVDAGDIVRVKSLLIAHPHLRNQIDDVGQMPIHFAANNGYQDIIKELCNGMALVSSGNHFGTLPVHFAAAGGHINALSAFLRHEKCSSLINAQNIYGFTPLHAAMIYCRIAAARRLLDEKADPMIKDVNDLSPYHYAAMQEETKFAFIPEFAIPKIVALHRLPSPREDNYQANMPLLKQGESSRTISEQTTTVQTIEPGDSATKITDSNHKLSIANNDSTLDIAATMSGVIEGKIVSSLQQERPNGEITAYCGYYALYNALALLYPQKYDRRDRASFCNFFGEALQVFWGLRKYGPCDNLMDKEIRHLIKTCYSDCPIVVLDKNALASVIFGEMSLAAAFDGDEKSLNLWRAFTDQGKKSAEIAIIAGYGKKAGHWIVIHAKRDDKAIALQVADSLHLVQEWTQNMIISSVLPFYLALIQPEKCWGDFFDKALNNEIFAEYVETNGDVAICQARNANILVTTLDTFVAQIDKVNEIFGNLVNNKMSVDANHQLLTFIQLQKFISIMNETIQVLIMSKSSMLKEENQATQAIDKLIYFLLKDFNNLPNNVQNLNAPETIATQDKIDILGAVNKVLDLLKEMRKQSQTIIEVLVNNNQLLTNENLFDADLLPLDDEHLKSIIDCAPECIRPIIGHLKNSSVEQQIVRILFVGPPGNGKTTLGQAIAQECKRPYRFIRASALGDSFQFSRERDLKRLLPFIQKHPNAVIIIDEIDAVKDRENEPNRTAEVLQSILDICHRQYPKVIFIATTNDQKSIPQALLSRFSQMILEIPEPDYTLRLRMIQRCCRKLTQSNLQHNITERGMAKLANMTDHFSIRHIEAMFRTAIINVSGAQKTTVCKPSFKAWLLRSYSSNTNVITMETMSAAYTITCESLKEEKASRLKKIFRFGWNHADKIGNVARFATEMGIQGYQMYTHAKERAEDLKYRDSWWNKASILISGAQTVISAGQLIVNVVATARGVPPINVKVDLGGLKGLLKGK